MITYTDKNEIRSKYVVIASHYPFINFPGIYFLKMYQVTSYALGIETDKCEIDGMYINVKDPTLSFRTAKERIGTSCWSYSRASKRNAYEED